MKNGFGKLRDLSPEKETKLVRLGLVGIAILFQTSPVLSFAARESTDSSDSSSVHSSDFTSARGSVSSTPEQMSPVVERSHRSTGRSTSPPVHPSSAIEHPTPSIDHSDAASIYSSERDLDFFEMLFHKHYNEYKKEIQANWTRAQTDAVRIERAKGDRTSADHLTSLLTIDYFKKILLGVSETDANMIKHLITSGDIESADRWRAEVIEKSLEAERARLEAEGANPKLKLARFKEWEAQDKLIRKGHQTDDATYLHAAIDAAFEAIEGDFFNPVLVKRFANRLQRMKNLHKNLALDDARKKQELQNIRDEILDDTAKLRKTAKKDKTEPSAKKQAEKLAVFHKDLDSLAFNENPAELAIDTEIIELVREAYVHELKIPKQTLKSKIANAIRRKDEDSVKKSNHELDYLRRRMGVNYSGSSPNDYRADFFQHFDKEKSFFNEEILGTFEKIPAGSFMMGSPETEVGRKADEIQHRVTLSGFEFMNNAITQATYAQVMKSNPSEFKKKKHCKESFQNIEIRGKRIPVCADLPVEKVSWNDAAKFVEIINRSFSDSVYTYRLPTEAEQEYAFRGGSKAAYINGEDLYAGKNISHLDSFVEFERKQTYSPIRQEKTPNRFKILRSGVWEWSQDWFGKYAATEVTNPQGPRSGEFRVLRGGGFSTTEATEHRSARRAFKKPNEKGRDIGFRLVRVLKNRHIAPTGPS